MKRVLFTILFLIALGGAAFWLFVATTPPPPAQATAPPTPTPPDGLQQPMFHNDHRVATVEAATPTPTPVPVIQEAAPVATAIIADRKFAPMRIYTSQVMEQPTPEPAVQDTGDYGPFGRLVRCKLVNTVDSSNITTPVIGLVTDDVVFNGKVLIPKCSEIHGIAQVEKSRERIVAEGVWVVVLYDKNNPGLGKELILKGSALDREDDPEFKKLMVGHTTIDEVRHTWGITDASAGLRGVVIKTNNGDILNAFVASFLGGLSATVTQFSTVIAPEQGGNSVSAPAYLAAPAAQGIASVMNTYAKMVMDNIEKDGFFIRVPAGKQFYVYVTEDILTGKATVGGSKRLNEVRSMYLEDRDQLEKVTQSRAQRDEAERAKNAPAIDPMMIRRLDDTNNRLEQRSQELQNQSLQLQEQSQQAANPPTYPADPARKP